MGTPRYKPGDKIKVTPHGMKEIIHLCNKLSYTDHFIVSDIIHSPNCGRWEQCHKKEYPCSVGYRFVGDEGYLGTGEAWCNIESCTTFYSYPNPPKQFKLSTHGKVSSRR